MSKKGLLGQLIQSFCCLPGIGAKSSQRMVFHLLQKDRQGARKLADLLVQALEKIQFCAQCHTLTEEPLCSICIDTTRDHSLVCVVETSADVWAVEQAAAFKGRYFVLHGRLSPLDGIGPEELGVEALRQQLSTGAIAELVLATNATLEGDATAYYLADLARKHAVKSSRIAHGMPVGGELEHIDSGTLAHAINDRKIF